MKRKPKLPKLEKGWLEFSIKEWTDQRTLTKRDYVDPIAVALGHIKDPYPNLEWNDVVAVVVYNYHMCVEGRRVFSQQPQIGDIVNVRGMPLRISKINGTHHPKLFEIEASGTKLIPKT